MKNMMRDEILADCIKGFPCIYDKKDKGHQDCTVLGAGCQKVKNKTEIFRFSYGIKRS